METEIQNLDARLLVQREITKRIEKNPSYSLRAFAKAMGVSHANLSLVISGKRKMSVKGIKKLCNLLGFNPQQIETIIKANSGTSKKKFGEDENEHEFFELDLDAFAIVSDWYHYAILSLLNLSDSKLDANYISKKLGITKIQARLAVERLHRMNLITKTNGKWHQASPPIKSHDGVSTSATRKFLSQVLDKAKVSLETIPVTERKFSSLTFSMDASAVAYAEKRIDDFRLQLKRELEAFGRPTEVYNLSIQLFPLTVKSKI